MQIKDIQTIIKKKVYPDYQIDFYKNCSIEEKLDTHYVSVDVISNSILKFRKTNNKEITQIDLIVNKSWSNFIDDWKSVFEDNKEVFKTLIGSRISMFYFPNSSPLSTYYKTGFKYIIKSIIWPSSDVCVDVSKILNSLQFSDKTKHLKTQILKFENLKFDNEKFLNQMTKDKIKIEDYPNHLFDFIDKDALYLDTTSEKAVENNCLELILRKGKTLYQYKHKLNGSNVEITTIEDAVVLKHKQYAFELVLQDFIQFASIDKGTKDKYIDLITKDYIESVNNIFLYYIQTRQHQSSNKGLFKFLSLHLKPSDLTPPCLGTPPEINLRYINNNKIKDLILLDPNKEWIENIYKILLVNLKLNKKIEYCHYLNKNEIDKWNEIVKNINIRNSML